jgi:hypothetical protein
MKPSFEIVGCKRVKIVILVEEVKLDVLESFEVELVTGVEKDCDGGCKGI